MREGDGNSKVLYISLDRQKNPILSIPVFLRLIAGNFLLIHVRDKATFLLAGVGINKEKKKMSLHCFKFILSSLAFVTES